VTYEYHAAGRGSWQQTGPGKRESRFARFRTEGSDERNVHLVTVALTAPGSRPGVSQQESRPRKLGANGWPRGFPPLLF